MLERRHTITLYFRAMALMPPFSLHAAITP